ncbi:unnamed protein product [Pocillopora meandrina]|uniref:Fibrinogen C-terminal domain-containing protein n=1 Tax=Pocillopora meandrina TaxID=46732 RepID=A0AAU9X151_9CNID|nr:unnamed protein product [Pocillopora meandrina]
MLRVDLEDFEGNTAYAEYKIFGVMSEKDKYKLILGSYSEHIVTPQVHFVDRAHQWPFGSLVIIGLQAKRGLLTALFTDK